MTVKEKGSFDLFFIFSKMHLGSTIELECYSNYITSNELFRIFSLRITSAPQQKMNLKIHLHFKTADIYLGLLFT